MKIEQRTCKYIFKSVYFIEDEKTQSRYVVNTYGAGAGSGNVNMESSVVCNYQLKQTLNGNKLR